MNENAWAGPQETSPVQSAVRTRQRRASNALFGIVALHVVHVTYALRIAIPDRLVVGHLVAAFLFIALLMGVTIWIAIGVRGGQRIAGGFVMAGFFLLSSSLSAALAAKSKLSEEPGFVILDVIYAGWCVVTLVLLLSVLSAKGQLETTTQT